MPVEISLENLVAIKGTSPVWPEKFAALIAALQADSAEATTWGALADWCGEHGEAGLERAARWAGKRGGAGAVNSRPRHLSDPHYRFETLPAAVSMVLPQVADRRTLAGLLADLAAALRVLDEDIGH